MKKSKNKGKTTRKDPKTFIFWIVLFAATIAVLVYVGGNVYHKDGTSFMGESQGKCPEGEYEVWSGRAPKSDGSPNTSCLTRELIKERKSSGEVLKPVIYLYSDQAEDVSVNLDFPVSDSFYYPRLNKPDQTWQARTSKDGIINVGGSDYNYLFWEGNTTAEYSLDEGFIVKKDDIINFLETKLEYMGLTTREQADFITFWGPKLSKYDVVAIKFPNQEYIDLHPMNVNPKPDYVLRIFMIYKPVNSDAVIPEQNILRGNPLDRHGLSLIEWGGKDL